MDLSIVITSYNYGNFLNRCIYSCLNQIDTSIKYEIIIVDDGSTDNSQEILSKFNNPIIQTFRFENQGVEKSSNFGFNISKGKFLVRVDADDILCNNFLSIFEKYMNKNCSFFYPDYFVIDSFDNILSSVKLPDYDPNEIICRGDFLATGTIYSSTAIKKIGGYNVLEKNSGLENFELILQLLKSGLCGFHIPQILFKYRRHNSNLSITKIDNIKKYGNFLADKFGLSCYKTNKFHPYNLKL